MNDKENILFSIDQNEEFSEKNIKINDDFVISTNETSYEHYDESYEKYDVNKDDGEEYWDTYDGNSTDVQSYRNFILGKLRRWKWRMLDICVLILLVLLILGVVITAVLVTMCNNDKNNTKTIISSSTTPSSTTAANTESPAFVIPLDDLNLNPDHSCWLEGNTCLRWSYWFSIDSPDEIGVHFYGNSTVEFSSNNSTIPKRNCHTEVYRVREKISHLAVWTDLRSFPESIIVISKDGRFYEDINDFKSTTCSNSNFDVCGIPAEYGWVIAIIVNNRIT